MVTMKVFVVTRQDLDPGTQAVQSCRALMQFNCDHPELGKEWYVQANELTIVVATGEPELRNILQAARTREIKLATYHYTGQRTQLVAVALESCPKTRRLVSGMPTIF